MKLRSSDQPSAVELQAETRRGLMGRMGVGFAATLLIPRFSLGADAQAGLEKLTFDRFAKAMKLEDRTVEAVRQPTDFTAIPDFAKIKRIDDKVESSQRQFLEKMLSKKSDNTIKIDLSDVKGRTTAAIEEELSKELAEYSKTNKEVAQDIKDAEADVIQAAKIVAIMHQGQVDQEAIDDYLRQMVGGHAALQELATKSCKKICALKDLIHNVKDLEKEFICVMRQTCQQVRQTCGTSRGRRCGLFGRLFRGDGSFLRFLFVVLMIVLFVVMISSSGGAGAALSVGFL